MKWLLMSLLFLSSPAFARSVSLESDPDNALSVTDVKVSKQGKKYLVSVNVVRGWGYTFQFTVDSLADGNSLATAAMASEPRDGGALIICKDAQATGKADTDKGFKDTYICGDFDVQF